MPAPTHIRDTGADLIQLCGPDCRPKEISAVSRAAGKLKLTEGHVHADTAPGGLVGAITQLHRLGRFARHSCVVLTTHGMEKEGKLWVHVSRTGQECIEITELIRLLREGGREFGHPDWPGILQLSVCYLAPRLIGDPAGINLLLGHQGKVLQYQCQNITLHVLELLASEKARGSLGPSAQALFLHVSQVAPMSVTVMGKGITTLGSHVRTPMQAMARKLNIADVFANLLAAGEEETVRQFVQTWPCLVTTTCGSDYSAFSAAVNLRRWNIATLLMRYDHANWDDDLDLLLDLAHIWREQSQRLTELSLIAFERRLESQINPAQMTADALATRLVAQAADHMMESMQNMSSARQRALRAELQRDGQPPCSHAGVEQLLAGLARCASIWCELLDDADRIAMRSRIQEQLIGALSSELEGAFTG